jgi:hypothetical protein
VTYSTCLKKVIKDKGALLVWYLYFCSNWLMGISVAAIIMFGKIQRWQEKDGCIGNSLLPSCHGTEPFLRLPLYDTLHNRYFALA